MLELVSRSVVRCIDWHIGSFTSYGVRRHRNSFNTKRFRFTVIVEGCGIVMRINVFTQVCQWLGCKKKVESGEKVQLVIAKRS